MGLPRESLKTGKLSVPFSSGLRVQRIQAGLRGFRGQPFSPLFVGVKSATLTDSFLFGFRMHLSVPFSSGLRVQQ